MLAVPAVGLDLMLTVIVGEVGLVLAVPVVESDLMLTVTVV